MSSGMTVREGLRHPPTVVQLQAALGVAASATALALPLCLYPSGERKTRFASLLVLAMELHSCPGRRHARHRNVSNHSARSRSVRTAPFPLGLTRPLARHLRQLLLERVRRKWRSSHHRARVALQVISRLCRPLWPQPARNSLTRAPGRSLKGLLTTSTSRPPSSQRRQVWRGHCAGCRQWNLSSRRKPAQCWSAAAVPSAASRRTAWLQQMSQSRRRSF